MIFPPFPEHDGYNNNMCIKSHTCTNRKCIQTYYKYTLHTHLRVLIFLHFLYGIHTDAHTIATIILGFEEKLLFSIKIGKTIIFT